MTTNKTPDYLKFDNANGTCDITLSRALNIAGASVTVLRMREPTVADQEIASASNESDAAREVTMFANLCDQTPDDIRRLPLRDYKRLQAAFVNFID